MTDAEFIQSIVEGKGCLNPGNITIWSITKQKGVRNWTYHAPDVYSAPGRSSDAEMKARTNKAVAAIVKKGKKRLEWL
jgi:hypothetical protein